MNEDLHGIDKLFQESLEGHAEAPPPHVWEQLDKKLDREKAATIAGRYNKLKWVAAALFLISVGMAMWVVQLHTGHPGNGVVRKAGNDRHVGGPVPGQGATSNSKTGSPANKDNTVQGQANRQAPEQTGQLLIPSPSSGSKDKQLAKGLDAAAAQGQSAGLHLQSNKADQPARREGYTPGPGYVNEPKPAAGKTRTIRVQEDMNKEGTVSRFSEGVQKNGTGETTGKSVNRLSAQSGAETFLRAAIIPDPASLANNAGTAHVSLPAPVLQSVFPELVKAAAAPVRLTRVHAPAFSATVFFSPNLVSSSVTNDSRIPHGREDDKNVIKAKEQNGSSRSAGALLDYNLNTHWSVGSGLVLTNRTTEIETKMIYARPDPRGGGVKYRFNCSSGYSYINLKSGGGSPFNGDSAKAVSSTSKLQYLSVPVMVKYNFGGGKLRFMTGAGLQANFLTMRKIQTWITKGSNHDFANTNDIIGLKPVYLSGLVSAGASYKLNRFLTASLMPTAQLGFMSINQRSPVKSYINFYGLSFGLSVKL